jgi:hypothetical protein
MVFALIRSRYRLLAGIFWVLLAVTILVRVRNPGYHAAWDAKVYQGAMQSLRAGHDPYIDGVAAQREFHRHLAEHGNEPAPFTYVYSPLTLAPVRWLGGFSPRWVELVYWLSYGAGLCVTMWVGLLAAEEKERPWLVLLAPLLVFFPGLLQNDVVLSGNIAYILFGLVFAGAALGWRRGVWSWFYLAVLLASCCKAPALMLLAIPVLTARRQWAGVGLTAAAGVALFAMQPHIWPELFKHYMEAVELQFAYNRDFSCSPAGLVADALFEKVPYKLSGTVAYLGYAVIVAGLLLWLRRRFFAGAFGWKQWVPVVLLGTTLLNPRVMEYDVAPVTVAMALIVGRAFLRAKAAWRWMGAAALVALNVCSASYWRVTEGVVMVAVFALGVWNLRREDEEPAAIV